MSKAGDSLRKGLEEAIRYARSGAKPGSSRVSKPKRAKLASSKPKRTTKGLSQLRQDVHAGLGQIARGDFREYDRASLSKVATCVKARGKKRLSD